MSAEVTYTIELTRMERAALLLILIEYARWPKATQEWIDIVADKTTTLEGLITKLGETI